MNNLSEILIMTSFPSRECGIATYSNDLVAVLNTKFCHSFSVKICALETPWEQNTYSGEVELVLNTSDSVSYQNATTEINNRQHTELVLIQHEFGFFNGYEGEFINMIHAIEKPVIISFHTVLPNPDARMKLLVREMAFSASAVVVMTKAAALILKRDYEIPGAKINVIAHGTHLVQHESKEHLKEKYQFNGRMVLSTFGLISSGKNIETTLRAMPAIIEAEPTVLFLVIGKTHPNVVKEDGEKYREMLQAKVRELGISDHVKFINYYLPLPELLEYLQLTDVYLFTSKDPNQAVSGTFSYAIGCGCPIISTPIPHAIEVLGNDAGVLIDFENAQQLADAAIKLLGDDELRFNIRSHGLHKIIPTAWENVCIAYAMLFEKFADAGITLEYNIPPINTDHLINMTTDFGMIQFSILNQPDITSGFTLDDNARAMIAICMHYVHVGDIKDLDKIRTYLYFIAFCMQEDGSFLNYVDQDKKFTSQNNETNLEDSNGRAIWALGYLISHKDLLPVPMVDEALKLFNRAIPKLEQAHSTRAMAFALKGLFYYHEAFPTQSNQDLANNLAYRLERMYLHECDADWNWYESYLTYGNSVIPEGMLCAYVITNNLSYKSIAKESMDFLLNETFNGDRIKVISNRTWLQKGESQAQYGEQPIDVAYTVLALARFYDVLGDETYLEKARSAFNWFLGNNHLHQIIYNPRTGGCYDGLEETHVNLNQGAESTVSYLMASITILRYNHQISELKGKPLSVIR